MAASSRKFFWITPKWPLPAEDGARRATVYLLKSLVKLGADVHLCSIVPEGESPDVNQAIRELGVRSVTVVHRQPSVPATHLKNVLLHPFLPLTVAPYCTKAVTRQINSALAGQPGREVVFDGLHSAGFLVNSHASFRKGLRKIYRAHNVESNLWVQAADRSSNPLKAQFLSYQAHLMRKFEGEVSRESVLVAAVSRDDESGLQKLYGRVQTANIPIGMALDADALTKPFPTERKLLFIGRLDWQPNKQGLAWFLEKVWPQAAEQSPDLSLTVVGAGDGRWLEPFMTLPRVRILGRVPEVAPFYYEAAASLVPVFFGSGTRVKAIEASSFGRPCLSTAIGVEGIGLDENSSYFRAESTEEWLKILRTFEVKEAQKRGKNAFDRIATEFDPMRIARNFIEASKS